MKAVLTFISKFRQSWRNSRSLGDSGWFVIRQALGGHFLTDEGYKKFQEGLIRSYKKEQGEQQ